MIARLRGQVWEVADGALVLDVGGVGYEVFAPEPVLVEFSLAGLEADLYVRQVVREDGVSLYGFSSSAQKRLFDLLMTVKGCGPKVGLSLLSQGDHEVLTAIALQDPKPLTRATGVGARLAERILLELKDKVQEEALRRKVAVVTGPRRTTVADELVDALLNLGYRRGEAEAAAEGARDAGSLEDQIKSALRNLAKGGA